MTTNFGTPISAQVEATDIISTSPILISVLQTDGTYKSFKITQANYHKKRQVTLTTNSIVTDDQDTIIIDTTNGNVTATLPDAVGRTGQRKTFKKIVATNNAIIACAGAETIDGLTTQTLTSQWSKMTVESNGSNWITV